MSALRFLASLVLVLVALAAAAGAGEPPASPPTAVEAEIATLKQQVEELCKSGKVREAIPVAERVLALREKALGPEHPDTARSLYNLGLLYQAVGSPDRAETFYQRSLHIREKVLGLEHADTAASLLGLAQVVDQRGDTTRAVDCYGRVRVLLAKLQGASSPEVVDTTERLGVILGSLGRYAKARTLLEEVVRERIRVKEESPETATALDELGTVFQGMGLLAEAESGYRRALRIRQRILGPGHAELVTSLDNLAGVHQARGEYAKAEILEQQALAIAEKSTPDSPMAAQAFTNMGLLYYAMGDLPRAEVLYKKALALCEKLFGMSSPHTATTLGNLGLLYQTLGDELQAETLLTQALAIKEKALGARHPDTATAQANLAGLFFRIGRYAPAQRLYERTHAIREAVLGPDHPDTLRSLDDLGAVYLSLRLHDKAATVFDRVLKLREKQLGPKHPEVASALNNLALARQEMGQFDAAAALYQRALAVYQRALGDDAPVYITTLMNLAVLEIDRGRKADAIALANRARALEERFFGRVLSFTSERQRLAYESTTHPYQLLATLGQPAALAESLLRRKGVVLDSIVEDRRVAEATSDAEARGLLGQLRSARERLARLMMEAPRDTSAKGLQARAEERATLQKRVEELESLLARRVRKLGHSREALKVSVSQVQQAMPAQAALVDFIQYPRYLGRGRWNSAYGAVVMPAKGEPTFVSLGDAGEMEQAIRAWQRGVRNFSGASQLRQKEFLEINKALYDRCWAPVQAALPASIRSCIISPDSELNFVSFAALVGPDDKFLAEKYTLRYVTCGRDILRTQAPTTSRTMVMFGNPDFAAQLSGDAAPQALELAMASPADLAVARGMDMRDLRGMSFVALPGTARECADLATVATRAGWQPEVYEKSEATKARLRNVRSPFVLHLATHGFVLPDLAAKDLPGGWNGTRSVVASGDLLTSEPNPMLRSGMALAGAQTTIDAMRRGLAPPLATSGILTAEEVALLPLEGTWLVALSACETGAGEARRGEGVLGLRRGFVLAGSQNLLMTLWPIADAETADFMREFYEATRKAGAPDALAHVQRDWLVRLRSEGALTDAIRLAGPFILSGQGR